MRIAEALGEAAEESASSSLGLLEPLGQAGSILSGPEAVGIVSEALQATFARLAAPIRAFFLILDQYMGFCASLGLLQNHAVL